MRVFKFGGASVKDAASVKNIHTIVSRYKGHELVIIISAMGKTTNALERLAEEAYSGGVDVAKKFQDIKAYHLDIAKELFPDNRHEVHAKIEKLLNELHVWLQAAEPSKSYKYDLFYDQIVPFGELLSTRIVNAWLSENGYKSHWLDAREMVITDDTYRSAKVDWQSTHDNIHKLVDPEIKNGFIVVSQGFIGSNVSYTTTLGREGSDFSAAIFASVLDADEVVVWKDVPGYLNADPDYFNDTVKLDKISYTESIELAFYGAKIIHPKTIRPLKNKNIPLLVKSFLQPETEGSIIQKDFSGDKLIPSYIIKEQQVLISISSRDFSFIAEDNLHEIFGLFAKHRIGINLMQNSAISFSVCVDESSRLQSLIKELQENFHVKYNVGLQLLSIRHYEHANMNDLIRDKEILLEQRSRLTVQMVMKI